MKSRFSELIPRLSMVLLIAAIALGSIEIWGYYRGLNVLMPFGGLCLIVGTARRNVFLVSLAAGTAAVYLVLSCVTVAQ